MKLEKPIFAACVALAAGLAMAQGMSMPMKPASGSPAALPQVDAEVRKLDTAKGTIVLRHKEIPNMGMGPMTMQFDVADKKMLRGVKPGDKVKFTVDMVGGKPTVLQLRPAK